MEQFTDSVARPKRSRFPETAFAPPSSAQKRTRVAGSKNLKQHEWALIHHHLLQRNKENKDTIFVIHGVKHSWHNVHRRILRATARQLEPLQGMCPTSLTPLPSYIELRSPSPEPSPLPRTEDADAETDPESPPQRTEEVTSTIGSPSSYTTFSRQSDEFPCGIVLGVGEDDTATARNALLRKLPLSEMIEGFRSSDWSQPMTTSFTFFLEPFGPIMIWRDDSVETFIDRICSSNGPRRRMGHLEMILTLIRKGHVSASYFLEAVVRNANGGEVEVLKSLAREVDIYRFGARALGTAAYRNNLKAVEILLDECANVNGNIFGGHSTPNCPCLISVIDYAQLPRFGEDEPGASDEMIAYLLGRGATKSTQINKCLSLLSCVLRQNSIDHEFLISKVRSIIQRIRGFVDGLSETDSVLETCILELRIDDNFVGRRFHVIQYLLDQGAGTSSGSPLAALIYTNGPDLLVEKLLAKTENINAYCNSISANGRFPRLDMTPQPYNGIQSLNPLQAASLRGKENIIRLLLQNGADVNCPARGSCGITPLQAACWLKVNVPQDYAKKMRIVKLLLDHGANVNAAPAWNLGLSALQVAAFVGDVKVADQLVVGGADVSAPACRYGGGTALAKAAEQGDRDMVAFLLEVGAMSPVADMDVGSSLPRHWDMWTVCHTGNSILDLLHVFLPTPVDDNSSRDYREYEAEWAHDSTYINKD